MTQVMFQAFNVSVQAVLSIYASGRLTAAVLDSGDGVSHAVPVYEGFTVSHAIQRLNVAGHGLTDTLIKQLGERGYPFQTVTGREVVEDIKKKLRYVAYDSERELDNATRSSFIKQLKAPGWAGLHHRQRTVSFRNL